MDEDAFTGGRALSKTGRSTWNFRVRCLYTSMSDTVKTKRNELREVYFVSNFVTSVFVTKMSPGKWLHLTNAVTLSKMRRSTWSFRAILIRKKSVSWYQIFCPHNHKKGYGGGFGGITVIPKMHHDRFVVVWTPRHDTRYHRPTFHPFVRQNSKSNFISDDEL